jgi:uncharacterized protein (DUF305 family)
MNTLRLTMRSRLSWSAAAIAAAAVPRAAAAQQGPTSPVGPTHGGMPGGMTGQEHSGHDGMGMDTGNPGALWTPGMGRDPAPDAAVARLEAMFLAGMVPHHQGAIHMAQLVPERSARDELKALARQIIRDQAAEIEQMSTWLRDWYGVEPPAGHMLPMGMMMPMMDTPMMHELHAMLPDMETQMAALRSMTGRDFDVAFMSGMIDHHAMAVMMAAPILIHGHHADLYTLAEQIVVSQGQEIRQMDEWLDAWYGVRRPV